MVPRDLRDRAEGAAAEREEVCILDPPRRPVDDIIVGENGDGTTLTLAQRDRQRKKNKRLQSFHIQPVQQRVGGFLFYAYKQAAADSDEYKTYPLPYQLAQVKTVTPATDGTIANTTYTVAWWYSDTGYSGKWRLWKRSGRAKGDDQYAPDDITHTQVVLGNVKLKTGATVKTQLHKDVLDLVEQLDPNARFKDFVNKKSQEQTLARGKDRREGDLEGETDVQQDASRDRVSAPDKHSPRELSTLLSSESEEEEEEEDLEEEDSEEEASAPQRRAGKGPMMERSSSSSDSSSTSASDSSSDSSSTDDDMFEKSQPRPVPSSKRRKVGAGDGRRRTGGGAMKARAGG